MIRKRILLVAACLVLAGAALAGDDEDQPRGLPTLDWQGHRDATERARAEGKPLMLYFAAPSCDRCRRMEKETFADGDVVRYLNEHFALAEVNADHLPALAAKYGVNGLPTLVFLDPEGARLTRFDGFIKADDLKPLMTFIVSGDYSWTDYETWREHHK